MNGGPSLVVVHELLIKVASLAEALGIQTSVVTACGLSSCGARA